MYDAIAQGNRSVGSEFHAASSKMQGLATAQQLLKLRCSDDVSRWRSRGRHLPCRSVVFCHSKILYISLSSVFLYALFVDRKCGN